MGGDWNAKHTNWGSRLITPKGRNLLQSITNHNCEYLSAGTPTYWPSDPTKIPDLLDFFILKNIGLHHTHVEATWDLSSDHTPIILTLSTHTFSKPAIPRLTSPKTDWINFRTLIHEKINLQNQLKQPADVDNAVHAFTCLIQEAAFRSTPPATLGKDPTDSTPLHIRALVTEKRRARSRWHRSRNPLDKREYNRLTRQLKTALQTIRNSTFETYISSLSRDDHTIWKATKQFKRPTLHVPPILRDDDTWSISDKDKATTFASHLTSVYSIPQADNASTTQDTVQTFLDSACPMMLPITPFSPTEVRDVINKCNSHKAPGYDLITGPILQELPQKAIVLLTTIYNSMLRLTYFPLTWKFAQIIMIHKPGKPPTRVTSYRPISLLPILSKIFERLFLKRLHKDANIATKIPTHQFGFRENHSTIQQCHRLVHGILTSLEEKKLCTAAFLDIQQAFDRVWHDGLLYKLKQLLPTPHYLLLQSYLSDRYSQIKFHSEISSYFPINSGVPQGSVLGPLLYLLFTADIPTRPDTILATFADDTAIMTSNEDPYSATRTLQNHLNMLEAWLSDWRVKVNETKSVQVTFTNRKIDCPHVTLYGTQLPVKTEVKYLGLTLDRSLTWKPHIIAKKNQINLKIRQMHWLIGRTSQLTTENKVLLYKAILKPIWTYGVQLWGCAKPSNTKILQRIQSKILRIAFNAPWYISNKTLHDDSGIPPVAVEIQRLTNNYFRKLTGHPNSQTSHLRNPTAIRRRLHRLWPTDIISEGPTGCARPSNQVTPLENCHWAATPLKALYLIPFTYSLLRQM